MKTQLTFTQGSGPYKVGTPYDERAGIMAAVRAENGERLPIRIKSTGEELELVYHQSLSGKTWSYSLHVDLHTVNVLGWVPDYRYPADYRLVLTCQGHLYLEAYTLKSPNSPSWKRRGSSRVDTAEIEIL